MKQNKVLFAFAIILFFASCRHDADLSNIPVVHFSTEIQGIFSANCSLSGCHDGSSEFSLSGYENVMASGWVKAGDAHASKLYRSVTGRAEIMPPSSRTSLTDKQLQQIYVWIEQGALNN